MRAPFVIGATVACVAGIMVFHPHSSSSGVTFNSPSKHAVGGTSTNGGGATTSAPPASGPAPGSATGGASSQPGPAATTTVPAGNSASGTASGNVTQYRFGVLQVTATVSGGRITNVSTQVQSSDPRSQQIDDEALPILRSQALSAQSANVQGVSGATYTSQAFVTSLQNALSSLGFK
jgi:uncharacterized protein with FMN-binding domain